MMPPPPQLHYNGHYSEPYASSQGKFIKSMATLHSFSLLDYKVLRNSKAKKFAGYGLGIYLIETKKKPQSNPD